MITNMIFEDDSEDTLVLLVPLSEGIYCRSLSINAYSLAN